MKKSTIQLSFPTERLEAVRHYMAEKKADITGEMEDALQRLYEKYVPKDVRGFLEIREAAENSKPTRPPRSPRPLSPSESRGEHGGTGPTREVRHGEA